MALGNYTDPRLSPSEGQGSGEVLVERKRLLISLLADRRAIRVICAPSLYGKTTLATQYARMAFKPEQVEWINADDPLFLVKLDSEGIEEGLGLEPEEGKRLLVIDGVGALSEARRRSFGSLLRRFHAKNCEIIIATEDAELAFGINAPTVVLDARELALSTEETPAGLVPEEMKTTWDEDVRLRMAKRILPAVLLDQAEGEQRFLSSLLLRAPSSREEALSILALVAGRGRLSLLSPFFIEGAAPLAPVVERVYPYAGIKRTSGEFCAYRLGNSARYELLNAHFEDLVANTDVRTEEEFLNLCADMCIETENDMVLSWLLSGMFTPQQRDAFYRSHGMSDVIDAWPLEDERDEQAHASLGRLQRQVPGLTINLFGRCEVTRGGQPVTGSTNLRKKAKLVIAFLLVNYGKDVPRTWIERTVWPGSDPNCARSSFYNLWSYVRKILSPPGSDPFAATKSRETVSLSCLDLESDVLKIEELCAQIHGYDDPQLCREALEKIEQLYCGPLLPGIQNDQLEAYRIAYQNRVLDAAVDGVRVLVRNGELRSAQRFAAFAFQVDATREDVVYLYMKVQRMLGQFAGAISTYVNCRRALVERFGIDGSTRLEELYEEILNDVSKGK